MEEKGRFRGEGGSGDEVGQMNGEARELADDGAIGRDELSAKINRESSGTWLDSLVRWRLTD